MNTTTKDKVFYSVVASLLVLSGALLYFAPEETEQANQKAQVPGEQDEQTPEIPSRVRERAEELEEAKEIIIHTNMGDIELELTPQTPITTANFLTLAEDDFYDQVLFHRVIEGFMIQGGDPNTRDKESHTYGTGGPGYHIPDEFTDGLSNERGTISMANSGPNSGGSQFFINTADNLNLDNRHAVFGRVTAGMEVVDEIEAVTTGPGDLPEQEVMIENITVPAAK